MVRGVFSNHSQKTWGGFYYGDLKEGNSSIRLRVPHTFPLSEGRVYVLSVTPELRPNSQPPIIFRVEALHKEEGEASLSPKVHLPQQKRDKVDVEGVLLDLLRREETPALALVLGETAIVHQDVEASLGSARNRYRIDLKRANLTDPQVVGEAITQTAKGPYHLLALIRGGGNGLEILDHPAVWEAVASCPKPIVVALGHAANTLWVESLADAAFPTPSALGHFLKKMVETVEREKEATKLADLLEKAQLERDQLREKLAELERKPAPLAQEVAQLKRSLTFWRRLALLALAVALVLWLARG